MSLQQRALFLVADHQSAFIESLVDIYQLKSVDATVLQQHVGRLQALNLDKEVSVACLSQPWLHYDVKRNASG